MNIFADTIGAMPDKAWTLGRGPNPDPCVPVPKTPAGEMQADEPGPAMQDESPGSGPVAGPGEAQTSAPGAPLDGTEPAIPPAGGEPSAEAPGAEQDGSEGESAPGDVVTREEVDAEFGPAPEAVSDRVAAEVRDGLDAAERGETVDLGSFEQYADTPGGESEVGQ